ncbi:hypothetical protein [Micromonospora avicenniae]|uniref:hypothetical protein n=1 Tax=Micromonospora avicenniae TaxID=1198245 RepID=UPI00332610EB
MSDTFDLVFNPDDLTLGDLEDFEDYVGKSFDDVVKPVPVIGPDGKREFDDKGRPVSEVKVPTKAITCLVWIMKRQDDPDFTIAKARRVKVSTLVITNSETDERGNG